MRLARKVIALVLAAGLVGPASATVSTASDGNLSAGFAAHTITPYGPSPDGWDFWVNPDTGIWSEEFVDLDGNGCYDPGEPHVDDPRNSLIDPQSTGKWDGIWANSGFGSKCAEGVLDDLWARAVVVDDGTSRVAMVSLDLVGFFHEEIQRAQEELATRRPDVELDAVVVSSTHTHNGPDTMGLWGQPFGTDGKFPLYQAFIRSRIVDAIVEAYDGLEPARAKFARAQHEVGLNDLRNPRVIDNDLWSAQFLRPDGSVIGTILNWSNHPEAMGGNNPYLSSDFPHATREHIEDLYGGVAVYFSGSVGGMMSPIGADVPGYGTAVSYERTLKIGELLADAAADSLEGAQILDATPISIEHREFFVPVDNQSLRAFNIAGVFDKPSYTAGVPTGPAGQDVKTEMYAITIGPAVFLTVPGELFPEITIGGYGRTNCPEGRSAHTGRPYEPIIRDQFDEEFLFLFGLGQDQLGYIVPGYDFWMAGAPPYSQDVDTPPTNQPVPFVSVGGIQATDPCGMSHYEETVSASSVLAPIVACMAADLAGRDPWNDLDAYPACASENTTTGPMGTHPDALTD